MCWRQTPVPDGWRVTSADFEKAGPEFSWHLGLLTGPDDSSDYVGLEQSNAQAATFVERVDPSRRAGRRRHDRRRRSGSNYTKDDETALVLAASDVTTVVTGTASLDDLTDFRGVTQRRLNRAAHFVPSPRRPCRPRRSPCRGSRARRRAMLADARELLAALPQRDRLLERDAAGLELLHRDDELVAGLFVAGGLTHRILRGSVGRVLVVSTVAVKSAGGESGIQYVARRDRSQRR